MPCSPESDLPTFADIEDAARRLRGQAVPTPLLESPLLNERLGCRLLVKAEMLQRTGSFKFRGAFNRLSRIEASARAGGVVAYSSGNHAQGVAAAAQAAGLPALIVMPTDAPAIKIANTRAYGAEVVFYDRETESREELGERLAGERGATLIRPYDDPFIIAGQGTAGLELADQAREKEACLDTVLAPCGGGGLVAGCALALAEVSPGTAVYAVEPAGFDTMTRSLAAGRPLENVPGAKSICDSLQPRMPGRYTFAIGSRLLAGGLVIDDAAALNAMAEAFASFKVVVEPGGAAALAAVLSGTLDWRGKTVAVVCSGGNVDADVYRRALATR